jgi:hypothetical protein
MSTASGQQQLIKDYNNWLQYLIYLHLLSFEFVASSNGPVVSAAKYRRVWSIIRDNPTCLVNNLAPRYFIYHGSHMDYTELNP